MFRAAIICAALCGLFFASTCGFAVFEVAGGGRFYGWVSNAAMFGSVIAGVMAGVFLLAGLWRKAERWDAD